MAIRYVSLLNIVALFLLSACGSPNVSSPKSSGLRLEELPPCDSVHVGESHMLNTGQIMTCYRTMVQYGFVWAESNPNVIR